MPTPAPRRPAAGPASRNGQLAQIHIARAALAKSCNLTEEAYRDLLAAKFGGLRSAAQLDAQQRAELLHHFQRMGWQGSVGGSQANRQRAASKPASGAQRTPWSPGVRKLWSLWQQLADKGLVKERSATALSAWCERQTAGHNGGGVTRVEWLSKPQLDACIESAKQWLDRATGARP